jgi:hypothetical protein
MRNLFTFALLLGLTAAAHAADEPNLPLGVGDHEHVKGAGKLARQLRKLARDPAKAGKILGDGFTVDAYYPTKTSERYFPVQLSGKPDVDLRLGPKGKYYFVSTNAEGKTVHAVVPTLPGSRPLFAGQNHLPPVHDQMRHETFVINKDGKPHTELTVGQFSRVKPWGGMGFNGVRVKRLK